VEPEPELEPVAALGPVAVLGPEPVAAPAVPVYNFKAVDMFIISLIETSS